MPDGRSRSFVAPHHRAFSIDEMKDVQRRFEQVFVVAILKRPGLLPHRARGLPALVQPADESTRSDIGERESNQRNNGLALVEQKQSQSGDRDSCSDQKRAT